MNRSYLKLFPIVLFGENYWRRAVSWEFLVEQGTIGQRDVDRLFFTDSVEDALKHVTDHLLSHTPATC